MGRREKRRGCCRKREQIIYKVLKWRGECSVIRKQNLECGELGVSAGEGGWEMSRRTASAHKGKRL